MADLLQNGCHPGEFSDEAEVNEHQDEDQQHQPIHRLEDVAVKQQVNDEHSGKRVNGPAKLGGNDESDQQRHRQYKQASIQMIHLRGLALQFCATKGKPGHTQ